MTEPFWLQHVLTPWFWFQPFFYCLHGWLATEMAIWLLFHPYEPVYVPFTKVALPFTPGIFPRGRKKLSVSIANTITDLLLTEQDIRKQAERLVTEENLYQVIDVLSVSVMQELQDVQHLRRLYRYLEQLLPPLSARLVEAVVQTLQQEDDGLMMLNQLLERLLPRLTLTQSQARHMADLVFDELLPSDSLRNGLIGLLSEDNTYRLQQAVRKRMKGWQSLMMQFVDLQKALLKFREFLETSPEPANLFIAELVSDLHLKSQLADGLTRLPLQRLNLSQSRLAELVKETIIQHQEVIEQALLNFSTGASQRIVHQLLRAEIPWQRWIPGFKQDLARFVHTYLHQELSHLVSRALPFISLNTVIVDKIDQFSAQELEQTIQRICKRELRWLAWLGAFLGFWLGLMANLISLVVSH